MIAYGWRANQRKIQRAIYLERLLRVLLFAIGFMLGMVAETVYQLLRACNVL